MIKSVGAEYVIIGHSERREYFHETNELLAKKTNTALKNELNPIFCIGETLQQREANEYFDVLKTQLAEGIFHLDAAQYAKLIIAYEPVWAIGTGKTETSRRRRSMLLSAKRSLVNTDRNWLII